MKRPLITQKTAPCFALALTIGVALVVVASALFGAYTAGRLATIWWLS